MNVTPYLLSHLPYLDAVAKEMSFTKAASAMNLTQAALSYQIKTLEEKLGVCLVLRQAGAQLKLTQAGQHLVEEYRHCAKRLTLALEQINHQELSGEIRISTPVDFGSVVMPRVMARVAELAPKIKFNLHTGDQIVDLHSDEQEMAVRVNNFDDVIDRRPVYRNDMAMVASEAYLAKHGQPKCLQDLLGHTLIIRQGSKFRAWSGVFDGMKEGVLNAKATLCLGNSFAIREAAKEGLGIALLPEFIVGKDISKGSLHSLFPEITRKLIGEFYIARLDLPQTQSYENILRQAFKEIYGERISSGQH